MKSVIVHIRPFCAYLSVLVCVLLLTSCSNIQHKTFRVSSSATGGKISLADPAGTGSPVPEIILGAFTQSVTTVPPNTNIQYESTSYELFSGHPLYTEKMKITSAGGNLKITDSKIEYNSEADSEQTRH